MIRNENMRKMNRYHVIPIGKYAKRIVKHGCWVLAFNQNDAVRTIYESAKGRAWMDEHQISFIHYVPEAKKRDLFAVSHYDDTQERIERTYLVKAFINYSGGR